MRVGACEGAGRCVEARVRVAGEPETSGAREGVCEVGSGRFWWQWTDLDEIYPMEAVRESNRDSEMEDSEEGRNGERVCDLGKRP
jgi:hypothetical protein